MLSALRDRSAERCPPTIVHVGLTAVPVSAIVNSKVPHVVFLDDFHNQDISSLLSEYTPLFKAQQKRGLKEIEPSHEIFKLY